MTKIEHFSLYDLFSEDVKQLINVSEKHIDNSYFVCLLITIKTKVCVKTNLLEI